MSINTLHKGGDDDDDDNNNNKLQLGYHPVAVICWFGSAAAAEPNQFRPDPARKLSANLYDIYHCCVYSEKLLMMDRGTVQNMQSFIPKIHFRN